MSKEDKFIDKIVNNTIGNVEIKPNGNWQSFQNNYLNNSLQITNAANNSTYFVNSTTKFAGIISSKLTIISTLVITVVGITYFTVSNSTENYNSKVIKNSTFNVENNFEKRSPVEITIAEENKVNPIKDVVVEEKSNENITNLENTGKITDTVNIVVNKDVVIKKTIIVKDTVIKKK